jgi:hypothetical protein
MKRGKFCPRYLSHQGILLFILMILSAGCGKDIKFLTSSIVPAAQGHVRIARDDNNNYIVKLHVNNLAEVDRLTPPKKSYVIWIISDLETPHNMGKMESNAQGLSKSLNATFEALSSSEPHKVFITAEDDPITLFPGSQIVLTTARF